jgi:hypothetical protein
MITEIEHGEFWRIHLSREESLGEEAWPDLPPLYSDGRMLRPEHLNITMRRGEDHPSVAARGRVILKSGKLSARAVTRMMPPDRSEWVDELVQKTREQNGLGPGKTGVGW